MSRGEDYLTIVELIVNAKYVYILYQCPDSMYPSSYSSTPIIFYYMD